MKTASNAFKIVVSSVGVDGPRRHRACQNEVVADLRQREPSVEQISRIGMDTSKHIFQLHGVNATEAPVLRKKPRRKAFQRRVSPNRLAPMVASGLIRSSRMSIGKEPGFF